MEMQGALKAEASTAGRKSLLRGEHPGGENSDQIDLARLESVLVDLPGGGRSKEKGEPSFPNDRAAESLPSKEGDRRTKKA